MRHTVLLLASLPLLTTACGPGKSSDDGSDGPMEPFDCSDVEGELVPHGEEVESADGCTTMVCSDGVLSIAEDRRATIAGDLELSTQAEVDAQVCLGTVEGALRITGAVTDLMPLMPLSRVGQGVEITATELVTMDGLQGLLEVGGAITVADNASLTRLGFGPRMSAFGDVVIQNNDALTTLAGAEFLGQCVACSTVARAPARWWPTRSPPRPTRAPGAPSRWATADSTSPRAAPSTATSSSPTTTCSPTSGR